MFSSNSFSLIFPLLESFITFLSKGIKKRVKFWNVCDQNYLVSLITTFNLQLMREKDYQRLIRLFCCFMVVQKSIKPRFYLKWRMRLHMKLETSIIKLQIEVVKIMMVKVIMWTSWNLFLERLFVSFGGDEQHWCVINFL